MLDTATPQVVEETDAALAAPVSIPLHPLDDRDEWVRTATYDPPKDVDIVQAQKWIDSMMGTTRNNESIYKLVWNGDRNYWHEFFLDWDQNGSPVGAPIKRPRVRSGAILDGQKFERDIFPPRWIILSRLEPEQYADSWPRESFVEDKVFSHYGANEQPVYHTIWKQIRPAEPPPVFWLWYMTIAEHSNFCCAIAGREKRKCFGKYAPPESAREILGLQKQADAACGTRSVYQKIDSSFITQIERDTQGYREELERLKTQSQIYLENPMALLGIAGAVAGDMTLAKGRERVKEYLKKQEDELARKI